MNEPRIYGVVETNNFGGGYPDERLIVACVLKKTTAEAIAKLLVDDIGGDDSPRYWKIVERGYKLQPGFEP